LWGRGGIQAVTITSVTEVIEVIGYQLWRGVLWLYLAGHLVVRGSATCGHAEDLQVAPSSPNA
jgi:hypothetical protein